MHYSKHFNYCLRNLKKKKKKKKLLLQEQTFYITIPNVHFVHTIFTLGVHILHMMRQNVYEECIKGV